MADNVTVDSGTGITVATDDVGSAHYQRVKIALGPDGTANDAEAGAGAVDTGTLRVTLASDDPSVALLTTIDTDTGAMAVSLAALDNAIAGSELQVDVVSGSIDVDNLIAAGTSGSPSAEVLSVQGTVAHDSAASMAPVLGGMKAIAHGANPTAVTANDATFWYANRAGVPWVIGGHPNVVCATASITSAQTDASLTGAIGSGMKVVVTQLCVKADPANSGAFNVRVGFGAATVPASAETAVVGLLMDGEFDPGMGHQVGNGSGIIGVGADGEELRIDCEDPGAGNVFVSLSYYTIES
jgi:hypothetical protein